MLLGHAPDGVGHGEERTQHVDLDDLAHGRRIRRLDARAAPGDPAIVDEMGEPPELLVDRIEHAGDVGFDAHVARDRNAPAPLRFHRGDDLSGGGGVALVGDGHVEAALRGELGGGGADAAAGTGDQHDRSRGHARSQLL